MVGLFYNSCELLHSHNLLGLYTIPHDEVHVPTIHCSTKSTYSMIHVQQMEQELGHWGLVNS
uniref:Uncharacterized protein n=1 Tax=Physcomitrium patens TaxID=3218 RepID=A0A2K1IE16_PHYPA|nr:hypothetical protein PHYPA_029662 [Physcomitrium patens]